MKAQGVVIVGLLGTLIGCGDRGTGGDSAGGSSSTSNGSTGTGMSGGLAMSIQSAKEVSTIDNVPASANHTFLEVTVTLTNESAASGISENFLFFTVVTDDKIATNASTTSGTFMDKCDANSTIQVGGMATCTVSFEISRTATPVTLHYEDPVHKIVADAAITLMPTCVSALTAFSGGISMPCSNCVGSKCSNELSAIDADSTCKMSFNSCKLMACATCACDEGCFGTHADCITPLEDCVNSNCADVCPAP